MKESTKDICTLSCEEMQTIAGKRVTEIAQEFTDGFKFLEQFPRSVTFFGANQFRADNAYYQDARRLAARISRELGYPIVSGGGPGIMEAANQGAYEAKGQSVGLLIQLPHTQVTNPYVTQSFNSYYFFVRKVLLTFSAQAFIFYPGGFGTLDEFFEILTLVQTNKIVGIPIICVGAEYWNQLKDFMEREQLGRGSIMPEDLNLFQIIDDHDQIIDIIKNVTETGHTS
jgi:uncharacterized protein (TIGR00730 family)